MDAFELGFPMVGALAWASSITTVIQRAEYSSKAPFLLLRGHKLFKAYPNLGVRANGSEKRRTMHRGKIQEKEKERAL